MTNFTNYICVVYLADGIHVSQSEPCATAEEAINRARQWTRLGHKAKAHRVVVNAAAGEAYCYPIG